MEELWANETEIAEIGFELSFLCKVLPISNDLLKEDPRVSSFRIPIFLAQT